MFHVAGKGAGPISMSFIGFEVSEADTLYAYAGASNMLLLGKYSGTQSPDIINSDSSALTFRFISGNSSAQMGWEAYWSCGMALQPQDLVLSGASIREGLPEKYPIGRFMVPDTIASACSAAGSGCISYVFCENNDDHSYFTISGDSLLSNSVFDFEKRTGFTVMVKAENDKGQYILNRFDIKVTDINEPPVAVQSVPDQTAELGEPFSCTLPSGLFTDPDAGDSIAVRLSDTQTGVLPAWLSFNAGDIQLSGIPRGKEGTLTFVLTASDREGAEATLSMNLVVEKPAGYVDSLLTDIEVFPDPASVVLYIVVSSGSRVYPYVDMYDYKGSKIGMIHLGVDALNRQKTTLDLSSLTSGLYFLVFKTADTLVTKKVLVIK